jgi:hypothetical protein
MEIHRADAYASRAGGERRRPSLRHGRSSFTEVPDPYQEDLWPADAPRTAVSREETLRHPRSKGRFKDIQSYARAHGADVKRKSKKEK